MISNTLIRDLATVSNASTQEVKNYFLARGFKGKMDEKGNHILVLNGQENIGSVKDLSFDELVALSTLLAPLFYRVAGYSKAYEAASAWLYNYVTDWGKSLLEVKA